MLCEKCGVNNATTHIRSVVNGVMYEKHLCSSCASSEGYNDIKGNNLSQMLSSMFGESVTTTSKSNIVHCDCCGSMITDIVKSGKCGCAKCYDTFYEQLLPYLKKAQYDRTTHKGKIPHTVTPSQKSGKEKIEELKLLLNQLVSAEKYEEAAVIRDKIKILEGEKM